MSQGDDVTNNRALISILKGLYSARERSHTRKSWGLYICIKEQASNIAKCCGDLRERDHMLGWPIMKNVIVEVRSEMSLKNRERID